MGDGTINREASDKAKGYRLQKLRAIKLMLETIEAQDNALFFTAIEDVEDISHTTLTPEEAKKYYEEDKNYDQDHNFTIFSPQVKNTLVSFFDIYVSWRMSEELRLGFYTTASVGKERKKFRINGVEVDPPVEPVLSILSSACLVPDNIVTMVKAVVVEEYETQYSLKSSKGNLDTLRQSSIQEFRAFLETVVWHFGEEDEKKLKQTVINLIKKSKWHNVRHENKEESIFSILMEMLDERQSKQSLASRVVAYADVKMEFMRAESEESDLLMDPTWCELRKIEKEITDKRNLEEKITSVCPNYGRQKLKHLARLACRSKTEQLSSNKTFLSLKYRTYEACSGYLCDLETVPATERDIDSVIEHLNSTAGEHIEELKKDYTYTISNSHAIAGLILDLFDSCFVSFDEEPDGKQGS